MYVREQRAKKGEPACWGARPVIISINLDCVVQVDQGDRIESGMKATPAWGERGPGKGPLDEVVGS